MKPPSLDVLPGDRGQCLLQISELPHVALIKSGDEDWAGITNQKERKRLQNRLNQRANRQRRKQQCAGVEPRRCHVSEHVVPPLEAVSFADATEDNMEHKRAMLYRLAEKALRGGGVFPGSENHLSRLIQWNVVDSLTRNSTLLGFRKDWMICAAISPFHRLGPLPRPDDGSDDGEALFPPNLAPTQLQRRIRHHPWIDLLPLPRLRDNVLVAVHTVLSPAEEEALWNDLIESKADGGGDWAGMIVWGEPWDPRSWELTVPFLQTWAWLLEGCEEILAATNYWRRQRGEDPIGGVHASNRSIGHMAS